MKIISLNIEKDKHFDKHKDFLLNQNPDVLCLQEVWEKDVEKYQKLLNFNYVFFQPIIILEEKKLFSKKIKKEGLVIFSKKPVESFEYYNIFEEENQNSISIYRDDETYHWKALMATLKFKDRKINIVNIHGVVTKNGNETKPKQLQYFDNLIGFLKDYDNLILLGDSNAPRGYEAFAKMDKVWKDNIPKKYTTSIDNNIHRAGYKNLQYVVDVLFSTNDIRFKTARYQDGLSDHFGLIAEIE